MLYRDNGKNVNYYLGFRVSQSQGYILGGPQNKDYNIWGSVLGLPS